MADGEIWWKAKNLPYKHAITAYCAAMMDVSSQIAYSRLKWQTFAIPQFAIDNAANVPSCVKMCTFETALHPATNSWGLCLANILFHFGRKTF